MHRIRRIVLWGTTVMFLMIFSVVLAAAQLTAEEIMEKRDANEYI